MATDNEDVSTTQFPDAIPQTIPELYMRLKARLDSGFGDAWKEISVIKEELRGLRQELQEVEQRLSEEIRQRYVDLRQRINKLQFSEDILDERFELTTREINQLKKTLRELENKVDPSLAA